MHRQLSPYTVVGRYAASFCHFVPANSCLAFSSQSNELHSSGTIWRARLWTACLESHLHTSQRIARPLRRCRTIETNSPRHPAPKTRLPPTTRRSSPQRYPRGARQRCRIPGLSRITTSANLRAGGIAFSTKGIRRRPPRVACSDVSAGSRSPCVRHGTGWLLPIGEDARESHCGARLGMLF